MAGRSNLRPKTGELGHLVSLGQNLGHLVSLGQNLGNLVSLGRNLGYLVSLGQVSFGWPKGS